MRRLLVLAQPAGGTALAPLERTATVDGIDADRTPTRGAPSPSPYRLAGVVSRASGAVRAALGSTTPGAGAVAPGPSSGSEPALAAPGAAAGTVESSPAASGHDDHVLHLPSPLGFARHALPALIESTLGPAVIFYVVLTAAGFRGALLAALGWSYVAAGRRLARRERMSGMLLLGVVLLTLRTAISFITGSAFVYFVQPSVGTFTVAVLFVVTAVLRRPLIERLARDFCPLDAELMARPHVRTFFLRISVLWALVLLTNVAMGLFLLLESSLRAFVIERTALSTGLIGIGVAVSVVWFVRTMRGVGVSVRWSAAPPPDLDGATA